MKVSEITMLPHLQNLYSPLQKDLALLRPLGPSCKKGMLLLTKLNLKHSTMRKFPVHELFIIKTTKRKKEVER